MAIRFPYGLDGRGRTAEADDEDYVRGLVEQVLFTQPGERLMRPDFGSGLQQLVFAPTSPELATAVQALVQGALQRWVGALIELQGVTIRSEEASLFVEVRYLLRRTRKPQQIVFTRELRSR